LTAPLGRDIKLRVGEATPDFNVMTLGPATPDPKARNKVKSGDKNKVAQRGAYEN
jgi:hypothetical protein